MNIVGKCELCERGGDKRCEACHLVHYCSVVHQKEDWKNHRTKCSPLRIQTNDSIGKHYVATRKIKPGTVLLLENPSTFSPRINKNSNTILYYCIVCCKPINKINKASNCSKCHLSLFCNQKCAKSSEHTEKECRYLKEHKLKFDKSTFNSSFYRGIMIVRAFLSENFSKIIQNLQSERVDKENSDKSKISDLIGIFKGENLGTVSDWIKINGAIEINSYAIDRVENEGEETSSVIGLYEKTSYFSHSCAPNSTWSIGYSPKFQMCVRSSVPIKKTEIITVNYNPTTWTHLGNRKRSENICQLGGFICNCRRCNDPTELSTHTSTLKCTVCKKGDIIPTKNNIVQCTSCNHPHKMAEISHLENQIEEEYKSLLYFYNFLPRKEITELVLKFINGVGGEKTHENHWMLQRATWDFVNYLGNQIRDLDSEELEEFIKKCFYLLNIANYLTPGISLERGMIQLYLSRALFIKSQLTKNETERVELIKNVQSFQFESLKYWEGDIQTKPIGKSIGFEGAQLKNEILNVLAIAK